MRGEGETEQAGDLAAYGNFSNLWYHCAHTYDVGMQSESENPVTFFAKTRCGAKPYATAEPWSAVTVMVCAMLGGLGYRRRLAEKA